MATVADRDSDVKLAELDGRNRFSLNGLRGALSRRYLITEHGDGTIVLEPATIVTAFEPRILGQRCARHRRARARIPQRRKWTKRHGTD